MSIASACANIALVKYWGKRDALSGLNLPQAGSLSVTLEALRTVTEIELVDQPEDELILDDQPVFGRPLQRIISHLDLFRSAGSMKARVRTVNQFPTAAGLASSASGFAALSHAAAQAYRCDFTESELSVFARRGSGSAARSIFGGYVQMDAGIQADGTDAYAKPLPDIDLELQAVIAVADTGEKEIGSTMGMEHTKETSPYHDRWIQQVDQDLESALLALRAQDFETLALVVEGSCLAMHADAMAARPGIIYFSGTTLSAIRTVRNLRKQGHKVFFTIDAGPHVVAFCAPEACTPVAEQLSEVPGVKQIITSKIGEGTQTLASWPED